jgi:hypothetical protein
MSTQVEAKPWEQIIPQEEGSYCPYCQQMTAYPVGGYSGDGRINGQMTGVDFTHYECRNPSCMEDFWD